MSSQWLSDRPVVADVKALFYKRCFSDVMFMLRKDSFMLTNQFFNSATLRSGQFIRQFVHQLGHHVFLIRFFDGCCWSVTGFFFWSVLRSSPWQVILFQGRYFVSSYLYWVHSLLDPNDELVAGFSHYRRGINLVSSPSRLFSYPARPLIFAKSSVHWPPSLAEAEAPYLRLHRSGCNSPCCECSIKSSHRLLFWSVVFQSFTHCLVSITSQFLGWLHWCPVTRREL